MIEHAYRVCCEADGCNNCTQFTMNRAEAILDGERDGYRRVRTVGTDGNKSWAVYCAICRASVAARKKDAQ